MWCIIAVVLIIIAGVVYWYFTRTTPATPASAHKGSSESPSVPSTEWIKELIEKHEALVFSKSYCPACKSAKELFDKIGMTPFVIELDKRDDGAEIQKLLKNNYGATTVPQIWIKGEYIGGSDKLREWAAKQ